MADTMNIKDWQSTIVWGIVVIFLGGVSYRTLEIIDAKTVTNASCNKDTNLRVDKFVEAVHQEEVSRMTMQGDIKSTRTDVTEIKADFRDFKEFLMKWDYDKKKVE
jgi:hypothetical protein